MRDTALNPQRDAGEEVNPVARQRDPNAPIIDPASGDIVEFPINDE